MYMVDPLHCGNPKDPLGSHINTLFADRTLFRPGPGHVIWVSLVASRPVVFMRSRSHHILSLPDSGGRLCCANS